MCLCTGGTPSHNILLSLCFPSRGEGGYIGKDHDSVPPIHPCRTSQPGSGQGTPLYPTLPPPMILLPRTKCQGQFMVCLVHLLRFHAGVLSCCLVIPTVIVNQVFFNMIVHLRFLSSRKSGILYIVDIDGVYNQQKIKLPLWESNSPTITGLEF